MIKIENTEVFGFEAAIRGMRNPLNSWAKSDSIWKDGYDYKREENYSTFYVGNNDLDLMQRLVSAGSDHSKFMRMIHVQCDVAAPLYWWKEYDTYKVGTVANSCSTMHKIHEKEFTLDDFSQEHLDGYSLDVLENIIVRLNDNRKHFVETNEKDYWWQMIQLLPSSYNQKRTIDLNYAVLRNMHTRKHHKLDEWREFCKWAESLPYSQLITSDNRSEVDEMEEKYHSQLRLVSQYHETLVQIVRNCAELERISRKDNLDMCDRQILEEVAEKMKGAF